MIIYKCDKCLKEIKQGDTPANFTRVKKTIEGQNQQETLLLCGECQTKVSKFIEEMK